MRSAMLEALTLTTEGRPPARARPAVRTSAEWVAYFRGNAGRLLEVPWAAGAGLTPADAGEVVDSLRAWQLGETSDGTRLLKAARRHAARPRRRRVPRVPAFPLPQGGVGRRRRDRRVATRARSYYRHLPAR